MFDFSNYSPESKNSNDLNKLAVSKMKDKSGGIAIKELVGLKPGMCSFLVDNSSEHNKGLNKNVAEKVTHSECKDNLLNKKGLRHLMIRIQSENEKIGNYEINKI